MTNHADTIRRDAMVQHLADYIKREPALVATLEQLEAERQQLCDRLAGLQNAHADVLAERQQAIDTCPLCGHLWRQHDPEDGKCDSHSGEVIGSCECGRDLAWMQRKIAALSTEVLNR